VEKINAQHQEVKENAEKCNHWTSIFTLNLCGLLRTVVNKQSENLENLLSRANDFGRRVKTLNQDIDAAIEVITAEIELISKWAVSAKVVRENIDQYPAEYLDKFGSFRKIFEDGLDNLKNVAQDFLIQTEILFKPSDA